MLFNSIPFLFLFLVTYLVYWASPLRWKKPILIIASLVFYSYNDFWMTFHFLGVIVVNYGFTKWILERQDKGQNVKPLVTSIVILNLVNLGFFKYFYFFCNSIYTIFGAVSVKEFSLSVKIFLPLAISFYTFQLLAIQIDTYRGKIHKLISPIDYFLFILFFPQLIAGPIMRSEDFLPKIDNPMMTEDSMKKGILLILSGLVKKVVIADSIGPILAPLFSDTVNYSAISLFLGAFGFSAQVYCDFSGYSDIARGLAFLMGFEIPMNFRGPFLAASFTELWGRWHITLSTWLRDYVYIPLGGNRDGFHKSNWNMLVTMTLGGFWHGANITYILWGFYLGVLLGLERIYQTKFPNETPMTWWWRIVKVIFTYTLFSFSGIFFRAGAAGDKSLMVAWEYFSGLFTLAQGKLLYRYEELALYIVLTLVFNGLEYSQKRTIPKILVNIWIPIYAVVVWFLMGIFGDGGGDFIYFQF